MNTRNFSNFSSLQTLHTAMADEQSAAEVAAQVGEPGLEPAADAYWNILALEPCGADQQALSQALQGRNLLGRPLRLVLTQSAQQLMEALEHAGAFHLIMLPALFDGSHTGPVLVEYVREICQQREVRILLGAPQPYASAKSTPAPDFLSRFDVSGLRCSSSLSPGLLLSDIEIALQAYEQLSTIKECRRGLNRVVHAMADLMDRRGLSNFSAALLTQLAALLRLPADGIVCIQAGAAQSELEATQDVRVIAAAGRLAECIDHPLSNLPDVRIKALIDRALREQQHLFLGEATVLYLRSDKHVIAVYLRSAASLQDLDLQLVEVFCANISSCFDNLELIEELNYLAYHDPLTRLGNRAQLLQAIGKARRSEQAMGLSLLDVRRFADINNAWGHEIGNAILVAIAERLRSSLSLTCSLARLSGDVFGIVGPSAMVHPSKLRVLFDEVLDIEQHPLSVSFACSYDELSRAGSEAIDATEVLSHANVALAAAKAATHRSFISYCPSMDMESRTRLELARRLRVDFKAGKLELWYQPQICLRSGNVQGLEALLRWPDGQGGMVATPDVFVPLAEQSGLIVEIGQWVLERACADWRDLQGSCAHQAAPARIGVNVSLAQFRNADLVAQLSAVIQAQKMPVGALELEITESLAMDEPLMVKRTLTQVRALGVRVAIDDFGTGYSSLSQLSDLPVDCLKVDRCFVARIGQDNGNVFAETIIHLGRRLGLELVAEGVETETQCEVLRSLGCHYAQGWRYAKAQPLAELRRWIANR
ncbi:putative bifunctional diguanylate cyclase/phosphodiesterase [Roseateles oligotrophus]|uniref:EAL domain-containing protein n=1 Tax=Roseateles oligotrophus TaxID=1769250 RepID=A0ABT2YIV5_9BURK|nr:EAL domain-containing protein [Roseateles oligotrophus]MCV2369994.1 EAL domain-containing protein [Roseateles oligotrophus]